MIQFVVERFVGFFVGASDRVPIRQGWLIRMQETMID